MAKNILFEASPLNASGTVTTVRMSMSGVDSSSVVVNGLSWLPVVVQGPTLDINLFQSGQVQQMQMDHGNISFRLHPDYGNQAWSNWTWDGQLARVYVGDQGAPWASYQQVFEGTMGPLQRDGATAQVTLLGPESDLNRNLLTVTYAGTGGAEGAATLQGVLKPRAYGTCLNVEGVLIDPAHWVYQFHAYGIAGGTTMVYENAYQVNATSQGDYATYAALIGATLVAGQWATCNAQGMWRLGGQPNGKITADVQGSKPSGAVLSDISTIVPDILKVAGTNSAFIDQTSFNNFSSYTWCLYQKEQVAVGDIAREALRQCGGYLFPTSAGVWTTGNFFGTRTATALNADRSTTPLVRTYNQQAAASPNYRVRIGYDRAWSTNSDSEISSALLDSATAAAAVIATAQAATDTANAAKAEADTVTAAISDIVSDNVLDRSEKAFVIREYGRISAEKAQIDATGTALGLTSLTSAYDTAYNSLTTYLNGLSPAYTDMTQSTTIVGTTFRTNFNNYYGARSAVLNAAAQLAGIAGYLTADSITLPASTAGVVSTFANANGRFVVMQGNSDISEQCTFSITSTAGFDSTGDYTLSNSTGSKGSYTIVGDWPGTAPATIQLRATFGSVVFDKLLTVVKSIAGTDGAPGASAWTPIVGGGMVASGSTFTNATAYSTGTYSAYVFSGMAAVGSAISFKLSQTTKEWIIGLDSDAAGTSSASSTMDYYLSFSTTGTVTAFQGATNKGSLGSYLTTDTFAVTHKGATIEASKNGTVIYTWTGVSSTTPLQPIARTSGAGAINSVAVTVVGANGLPGQDSVTGYLSNESHVLATDVNGNGGSLTGAGGTFHVWAGTNEVTTGGSVTFGTSGVTTGLTISIATNGVYTITGLTVDSAVATLTATYGTVTITKLYSISKSKAGAPGSAGASAITITAVTDHQTITYNSDGTLNPAVQPITLTAFKQNTSATVNWSIKNMASTPATVSTTYLSAATGDQVTMTAANFSTACGGTNGLTFTATLTDGVTVSDNVSIVKVLNGATGSQGIQGIQGIQGPTGPQGQVGNAGRDAMVFYQNSTSSPASPTTGDTWYQPDTKKWLRWSGTAWVQLLGTLSTFDQINATSIAAGIIAADSIGANQISAGAITASEIATGAVTATKISVGSLDAITQTVGLLRTATTGARVEIESNQIRVYDAANVMRVRLGVW